MACRRLGLRLSQGIPAEEEESGRGWSRGEGFRAMRSEEGDLEHCILLLFVSTAILCI
jgi:hypothetical protein